MGEHFCAFSFVDRILDFVPGVRAHARYAIPDALPGFPVALAAESVGQVAAWVAMAATDFRARPVAGLGRRIDILGSVRAGQTLDVVAELDRLDPDAITYRGSARVDGMTVVELDACVGPMLAADQFDDPSALRGRFEVLRGAGAVPGGFPGVAPLPLRAFDGEGSKRRATLDVPASAPFFADHFPRRPVLPGTLLLDAMFRLAVRAASDGDPAFGRTLWAPRAAMDVKIRAFTAPGETLGLEAMILEREPRRLGLRVAAKVGAKSVASARVELRAGGDG